MFPASPAISASLLGVAVVSLLLGACSDGDRLNQRELSGSSMGTTFSVKLIAAPAGLDEAALQRQIESRLAAIEQSMSTYISDSDLTLFNESRSTDWLETSAELCNAIAGAQSISRYTDGAFDVTVGPLVNLWGFGPGEPVSKPPDGKAIDNVMRRVGYRHLQTDCAIPALRKTLPELYVDLSAYAKGYAVDEIAALLDERKLPNYLVEIGGELRVRGVNAGGRHWSIAVEKPMTAARSVQSIVDLTDTALATSGDYRNYFEHDGVRYSHTIDPETGAPVAHALASVTVVAETAAFADAIATALLVLGPVDGMEFAEREQIAAYFLLRSDSKIEEFTTTWLTAEIG